MEYRKDLVIIRGGGDLGTGIAHKLFTSGYKVVILEVERPLAVRRAVSFCEAVYEGEKEVEGVKGILARNLVDIYRIINRGFIPVFVDEEAQVIKKLNPLVVVDAIMAKKNTGTSKDMAPITIAIGPGFEAGKDVDLVVESHRGPELGRIIYSGRAQENTGVPGDIMGYTTERVLRAPCDGIIRSFFKIGDMVNKGDVLGKVGELDVVATIDGVLRGMIRDGLYVKKGLKIGDIDPRGIKDYVFTISDKAKIIGDGVFEAIEYLKKERNI
jgi:xanthine dehydrogenase accessory factor